jgi:hypothetical protein
VDKKFSIRQVKAHLKKDLCGNEFQRAMQLIRSYPFSQAVSPLISFFCSPDKVLKWRAISAMGVVVNLMAVNNMEDARVVIRRLMWTLNEESGGVGWGAPETMGEIMFMNPALAAEYHRILFSYIDDHGNFLDYEPLQEGVLWGINRLAEKRPELAGNALALTRRYLTSGSPSARALAIKISANTGDILSEKEMENVLSDETEVELYDAGEFRLTKICSLASAFC